MKNTKKSTPLEVTDSCNRPRYQHPYSRAHTQTANVENEKEAIFKASAKKLTKVASKGSIEPGKSALAYKKLFLQPCEAAANSEWKKALSEHILNTLHSISVVKKLGEVPERILAAKKCLLPRLTKRGTIVFDLDETLVHCMIQDIEKADHQMLVSLPEGGTVKVGLNVRPYVRECLADLAKDFELIAFSAGSSFYAEKVMDIIDPKRALFSHRFYRENCVRTNSGFYIKDLRIFNRDLAKIIIVDNSVLSFGFQLDNGIPIMPFYDNKKDTVLLKVTDYILSLKKINDYRLVNMETFGLGKLYDLNVHNFIKHYEKVTPPNSNANSLPVNENLNGELELELIKIQDLMQQYLKSVSNKSIHK